MPQLPPKARPPEPLNPPARLPEAAPARRVVVQAPDFAPEPPKALVVQIPDPTPGMALQTREAVSPSLSAPVRTPPPPPKPHDWETDAFTSAPSRTCRKCGVTMITTGGVLVGSPQKYTYTDSVGRQIHSMVELGCPVFVGDTNGSVAEAKERVRQVDGRVDGVEDRVDSVEARLVRLEVENSELRARLNEKIELNVTGLVRWLSQMAMLHAQHQLPTVPATVTDVPLALPAPVAELIIEVGRAREPVPARPFAAVQMIKRGDNHEQEP